MQIIVKYYEHPSFNKAKSRLTVRAGTRDRALNPALVHGSGQDRCKRDRNPTQGVIDFQSRSNFWICDRAAAING